MIEQIPGKVSGRPIVRGRASCRDGIVNSCDMGETSRTFGRWAVAVGAQIKRLIEYAKADRAKPHLVKVLLGRKEFGARGFHGQL